MKTLELEIISGELSGKRFAVKPGGIKLGRSSSNDIFIPDPELSRAHCIFEQFEGGVIKVTDLASANGTLVNGENIGAKTRELKSGDIIEVGDTRLEVVSSDGRKTPPAKEKPASDRKLPFLIPAAKDGAQVKPAIADGAGGKVDLRRIIWIAAVLLLSVAMVLVMFSPTSETTGGETIKKPVMVPMAQPGNDSLARFEYEHVEGDSRHIFRFFLTMDRDSTLKVQIDEVGDSPRHVAKKTKLNADARKRLAEIFSSAEIGSLDDEYSGPDSEPPILRSYSLNYTIGSAMRTVAFVNTPEVPAFKSFREKLETFANNELALWALEYSADKLKEMATAEALAARTKYEDRDVAYGNLYEAIRNFEKAIVYLDTVNPKPQEFFQYQEEMAQAKEELDRRYREVSFQATSAKQQRDWRRAHECLGEIMALIVDREDERYRQAADDRRDVEKRLSKGDF